MSFPETRWYVVMVRDPQMVRDQKKFGSHCSRGYKCWTGNSGVTSKLLMELFSHSALLQIMSTDVFLIPERDSRATLPCISTWLTYHNQSKQITVA